MRRAFESHLRPLENIQYLSAQISPEHLLIRVAWDDPSTPNRILPRASGLGRSVRQIRQPTKVRPAPYSIRSRFWMLCRAHNN